MQWHELSEGARAECSPSQLEMVQRVRIDVLRATSASAAAQLEAMTAHAGALRARGDVHAALGAVLDVQAFVRAAGEELSGKSGWWRIEEARVLWDLRQQRQAIKLLDVLIGIDDAMHEAGVCHPCIVYCKGVLPCSAKARSGIEDLTGDSPCSC